MVPLFHLVPEFSWESVKWMGVVEDTRGRVVSGCYEYCLDLPGYENTAGVMLS